MINLLRKSLTTHLHIDSVNLVTVSLFYVYFFVIIIIIVIAIFITSFQKLLLVRFTYVNRIIYLAATNVNVVHLLRVR